MQASFGDGLINIIKATNLTGHCTLDQLGCFFLNIGLDGLKVNNIQTFLVYNQGVVRLQLHLNNNQPSHAAIILQKSQSTLDVDLVQSLMPFLHNRQMQKQPNDHMKLVALIEACLPKMNSVCVQLKLEEVDISMLVDRQSSAINMRVDAEARIVHNPQADDCRVEASSVGCIVHSLASTMPIVRARLEGKLRNDRRIKTLSRIADIVVHMKVAISSMAVSVDLYNRQIGQFEPLVESCELTIGGDDNRWRLEAGAQQSSDIKRRHSLQSPTGLSYSLSHITISTWRLHSSLSSRRSSTAAVVSALGSQMSTLSLWARWASRSSTGRERRSCTANCETSNCESRLEDRCRSRQ